MRDLGKQLWRSHEKPQVTVIGTGSFGYAMAEAVSRSGVPTQLVTRSAGRVALLRQQITGARLPTPLSVCRFGESPLGQYVLLALPSSELPDVVGKLVPLDTERGRAYISLSKGVTPPSGDTPLELLSQKFGDERCAVVSGPSLAHELRAAGATLLAASHNQALATQVAALLQHDRIRCLESNDPCGVEWAGIAKNVTTLGFHACWSATGSLNTAGAYGAKLYKEIWQYAATLGAQPDAFIGTGGIGDLLTTSHARTSRNVRAGQFIGHGHSAAEAEAHVKQTVESLHTIPLLHARIGAAAPTLAALSMHTGGEMSHAAWLTTLN